jgi:hypothetical protein
MKVLKKLVPDRYEKYIVLLCSGSCSFHENVRGNAVLWEAETIDRTEADGLSVYGKRNGRGLRQDYWSQSFFVM